MSSKNNDHQLSSSSPTLPKKSPPATHSAAREDKVAEHKKQPQPPDKKAFPLAEIPQEKPESISWQEVYDAFAMGVFRDHKLDLNESGIIRIVHSYYHSPIERASTDFKAVPGSSGQNGTDLTQLYIETATGNKWLGQCNQLALEAPGAHHYKRHYYEYNAWLGLALYRLLGIMTPERVLSVQKPTNPAKDKKSTDTDNKSGKYDYETPRLYTLTEQIADFVPLGKGFGNLYQESTHADHPLVRTRAGITLPLKGFGAAMAAATLLGDYKCMGDNNDHFGYVIKKDYNNIAYAQIVKAEATAARFYRKDSLPAAHPPIAPAESTPPPSPPATLYELLHPADQVEFIQTIYQILQIPKQVFYDLIYQTVCPNGLNSDIAHNFISLIRGSKKLLCSEFSDIISAQLQTAILKTQNSAILNYYHFSQSQAEEKKIKPHSVTLSKEQQLDILLQPYNSQLATVMELNLQMQLAIGTIKNHIPCYIFQIPPINTSFIIQHVPLNSISESLYHNSKNGLSKQVISGIGGVGKTQLAMRYAQIAADNQNIAHRRLHYQAVLWLNAECHLGMQFQAIAKLWTGNSDFSVTDAVQAVYKQLSISRTLIVFDHATDLDSLKPFLPPTQNRLSGFIKGLQPQHILITSRNPNWGDIPTLTLTGFDTEEIDEYVEQYFPSATHAEIDHLTDHISNLPLVLSHAMDYVKAGYCTLTDYPQYFAAHQCNLNNPLLDAHGKATLASTFLFPLLRLQHQHPCIQLLLETAAYLAPNFILANPLQKTLSQHSIYSVQQLKDGINALVAQSFLQRNETTFNILPIIQKLIRSQLAITAQHARLKATLQLVIATYPTQIHLHPNYKNIFKAFVPHFKMLVAHQDASHRPPDMPFAAVLLLLSDAYDSKSEKRCYLLQRALKIQTNHYGHEHPELVDTLIKLAVTQANLANTTAAFSTAQSAYHIMANNPAYNEDYTPMQQHMKTLQSIGISYKELCKTRKPKELKLEYSATSQAGFYPPHSPPKPISTPTSKIPAPAPRVLEKKRL